MRTEIVKQATLALIPLSYISVGDALDVTQKILGAFVLALQGGYLVWKWHRESKKEK